MGDRKKYNPDVGLVKKSQDTNAEGRTPFEIFAFLLKISGITKPNFLYFF